MLVCLSQTYCLVEMCYIVKALTELGSLLGTTTCDSFIVGLESVPNVLGKETNNFLVLGSTNRRKLVNSLIVSPSPDRSSVLQLSGSRNL